jgi:hypothetical protein
MPSLSVKIDAGECGYFGIVWVVKLEKINKKGKMTSSPSKFAVTACYIKFAGW